MFGGPAPLGSAPTVLNTPLNPAPAETPSVSPAFGAGPTHGSPEPFSVQIARAGLSTLGVRPCRNLRQPEGGTVLHHLPLDNPPPTRRHQQAALVCYVTGKSERHVRVAPVFLTDSAWMCSPRGGNPNTATPREAGVTEHVCVGVINVCFPRSAAGDIPFTVCKSECL